jgi:lipoprotein-releasing system ATP-binding protein
MSLLVARGLVKGYRTAAGYVPVLSGLDLDVAPGEMLAILGSSGVGKSTLLHVLGTLDDAESGTLHIDGQDVRSWPEREVRRFRNQRLGFVFQFHHLLPEFSALENVMMPLLVARMADRDARAKARKVLDELGLAHRLDHRPGMLSGGEQQRVALARAIVHEPRAVLADEPTGNLDKQTGEKLHGMLRELNQARGVAIVVVTHDERLAEACGRKLRLEGGTLQSA